MPQGSVLSPVLFNIYINDQPIYPGTRSFITQYYRSNSLRANPDKTQVSTFHLRNKEEKISLKVKWSNTELDNTDQPKYPGPYTELQTAYTQYKDEDSHTQQSSAEIGKLEVGHKCKHGQNHSACFMFSVAEYYAAPVWARSHHADSELNTACIAITGCLKPTNVEDMYLLAGIAPPVIRRDVCARMEKNKQESNVAHSLYGQNATESRLKSRSCFLSSVRPADFHPKVIRCNE